MNTTPNRRKAVATIAPIVVSNCEYVSEVGSRQEHIAKAAYYKAETRGFAHGMELQDWLDAEAEYDIAQRSQS